MATLEQLSQELALFQLNFFKWKNEVNAELNKPSDLTGIVANIQELVKSLEGRVKELEAARIVQRQLNQSFQPKASPVKKSFWERFKK